MKREKVIFCLFLGLIIGLLGKIEAAEELKKDSSLNTPLFVSLGSHCEVARKIQENHLRTAAFPFDWLLTLDYQGFFSLLEEDFAFFLDPSYLLRCQPDGNVINIKYNIDMRHDWPEKGPMEDFERCLPVVQEKYKRRIDRFNNLNQYQGKVYFIRAAYDIKINGTHPTITKECRQIDHFHAQTLRNILIQKFPDLDFHLIIINYVEENAPGITGVDKVTEFKVSKENKREDYQAIIQALIRCANESQINPNTDF